MYSQCDCCNDICDICSSCVDHECECTKADREVYELRQEVDDLKQKTNRLEEQLIQAFKYINRIEKMSCRCPTCAINDPREFV